MNIVEAHLLDRKVNKTSDFYGSTLRLCLVGFLRSEQKFESLDALVTQINADIQQSRDLCKNLDENGPLQIGRNIATDFFTTPFDQKAIDASADGKGLVWERRSRSST